MNQYTLAVDVMGGDYGPESTIPAALTALQQHQNLSLILVGDETIIIRYLETIGAEPQPRYRIHHTSQRIEMDESPIVALRHKTDSSMRVAIDLVKQGKADACVSAGNTVALVEIARSVLKTLSGIDRPAMSSIFPTQNINRSIRLLDLGASADMVDITEDHLLQFAAMGLVLSEEIDNITHPKLGLLNTGKEIVQSNQLLRKAGTLFTELKEELNYIGYLKGDMLFDGTANIIVCDGFSGNIALNVIEGTVKLIQSFDHASHRHWLSRLTSFVTQSSSATEQFEPNHYNGASLVGLQGVVIHSNSNADTPAFNYAIQYAITSIEKKLPERIETRISALLQKKSQL